MAKHVTIVEVNKRLPDPITQEIVWNGQTTDNAIEALPTVINCLDQRHGSSSRVGLFSANAKPQTIGVTSEPSNKFKI